MSIRNITNITQLRTFFIASITTLSISGCSFIPIQFTLADVGVTAVTGKSSTEHVASGVTRMDCQWSRLFIGWFPCLSNEEYLNNLMEMNCQTYSWNFLNNPYCKENV